jgi:hypothetical protein
MRNCPVHTSVDYLNAILPFVWVHRTSRISYGTTRFVARMWLVPSLDEVRSPYEKTNLLSQPGLHRRVCSIPDRSRLRVWWRGLLCNSTLQPWKSYHTKDLTCRSRSQHGYQYVWEFVGTHNTYVVRLKTMAFGNCVGTGWPYSLPHFSRGSLVLQFSCRRVFCTEAVAY